MVHITHRIGIKASLEKVYEALSTTTGIANWWTKDTTGTSKIGKKITVRFHTSDGKEVGSMTIEVADLIPNQKVTWKFLTGPQEWMNTEAVFDISQQENYTIVLFHHNNWAEEVEFKAHCSMKWAVFLMSLKQFAETGKGKPSPDDFKIDNWN